jgi:hypothetical protein
VSNRPGRYASCSEVERHFNDKAIQGPVEGLTDKDGGPEHFSFIIIYHHYLFSSFIIRHFVIDHSGYMSRWECLNQTLIPKPKDLRPKTEDPKAHLNTN